MRSKGVDWTHLNILIAEDEPIFQALLERILQDLGYAAKITSNGRELLSLMESEFPNMVILDCRMPQLDGYETAKAIRHREQHSDGAAKLSPIYIMAFTVDNSDASREKAFQCGMNAFVPKPANKEILARTILKGVSWLSYKRAYPQGCMESDQEYDRVLNKLAQLKADIGSDAAADLIHAFLATTPDRFEELRQAIRLSDATNLRRIAHSYKSVCQIFGLEALSTQCKNLEEDAQAENFDASARLLKEIEEAFQLIRELLAQHSRLPNAS